MPLPVETAHPAPKTAAARWHRPDVSRHQEGPFTALQSPGEKGLEDDLRAHPRRVAHGDDYRPFQPILPKCKNSVYRIGPNPGNSNRSTAIAVRFPRLDRG